MRWVGGAWLDQTKLTRLWAVNPAPAPVDPPSRRTRFGRWLRRSWTWLAALVATGVGLWWLIWGGASVCTQQLGGENSDKAVPICRAVQLTDPVVLAWAVLVLLLLWGTLSEGSVAGLFSFKKQVDQAVSDSKTAKETADRALLISQTQTNTTNIYQGLPGDTWRGTGVAAGGSTVPGRGTAENQTLRVVAELAITTILDELVGKAGLSPDSASAHAYTNVDGNLIRVDGPTANLSRTWPIGKGAVGIAWDERAFIVQKVGEPGFVVHPDYFISAVAAAPILNAAGRPIGVISLHSRAENPPELNTDGVFRAMVEATELMARVFVNVATWETDAEAPASA